MKKLFTILLALTCASTIFAYDCKIDGICYNLYKNEAIVTGKYDAKSYSGSVVIPASIKYESQTYPVTEIGDYAFWDCTGLTSVTIPNSVTTIGYNAFLRCSNLTSVTIGNSVTSIGTAAFSCCSSLASIAIPNSVTSIGYFAFDGCTGLTSITIPNSVTTIMGGSFRRLHRFDFGNHSQFCHNNWKWGFRRLHITSCRK